MHTEQPQSARDAKPTTIVVGVTIDDAGAEVLGQALALAARMDAVVHLCHTPMAATEDPVRDAELLELGEKSLHSWALARLFGTPHIERTTLHVTLGAPTVALVQLAADVDADMIVVGRSGRGRVARAVSGTVGQELIASAPCPVMVMVPPDYSDIERSPSIEPPPAAQQEERTLGRAHVYRYRRSVRMAGAPASVAPTGLPLSHGVG